MTDRWWKSFADTMLIAVFLGFVLTIAIALVRIANYLEILAKGVRP